MRKLTILVATFLGLGVSQVAQSAENQLVILPQNMTAEQIQAAFKKLQIWNFSEITDEMTDEKISKAKVVSQNSNSGRDNKERYAVFYVYRGIGKTKRVAVTVDGEIICGNFERKCCDVRLRFDDKKAKEYYACLPDDNVPDALMFFRENELIEQMRDAKLLKIELSLYRHGSQIYQFNVSGFK